MPDIAPGREEEFRRLQSWLAVSDRIDRLIEATERPAEPALAPLPAPARPTAEISPPSRGLRAAFAGRLARLARALHREAAAEAVLRAGTESPR